MVPFYKWEARLREFKELYKASLLVNVALILIQDHLTPGIMFAMFSFVILSLSRSLSRKSGRKGRKNRKEGREGGREEKKTWAGLVPGLICLIF